MKCPLCNIDLVMSDRQGIEIDYCPQCRGVWLDRGELDKIIERSSQDSSNRIQQNETPRVSYDHQHEDRRKENEYYKGHDSYKKKKRSGFLGDLFDFGD
ncbi:MAG: zf-TFIIB domain-containing protein [Patescibacteria group bacterium]|jgi:hypothetical protein